jgi:hypothetical protein
MKLIPLANYEKKVGKMTMRQLAKAYFFTKIHNLAEYHAIVVEEANSREKVPIGE